MIQIQSVDSLIMTLILNVPVRYPNDLFLLICFKYLLAPPVFIQEPADVSVEIGSNVTLPCYVQGYPEPKIKWQRSDNMPIFSRPFSVSSISQLRTGALFISSRLKKIYFIQVCTYILYLHVLYIGISLFKIVNWSCQHILCLLHFPLKEYWILIFWNWHK